MVLTAFAQQLIQHFQTTPLNYQSLGDFIYKHRNLTIDFQSELPNKPLVGEGYSRNILTMDPLEIALLRWEPGGESAVHHHEGFWGYVWVLDGEGLNVEYSYNPEKKILTQNQTLACRKHGIMDEPDGVIHKICNGSKDKTLVSLHLYCPPLETLDGMTLFCPDTLRRATLNKSAATASLDLPTNCYHAWEKEAFTFVSAHERRKGKSHSIYPVVPKPQDEEISSMLVNYYNEQAETYDDFDVRVETRNIYTHAINELIAHHLKTIGKVDKVLDMAGGTGWRSEKIRESTHLDYDITVLDMNKEMLKHAASRGLATIHSNILDAELAPNSFDSISFLYAFSHLPNAEARKKVLQKVYNALRPSGAFFFDVFNLENPNEWGPQARNLLKNKQLDRQGYEEGDVFYKKIDGNYPAYLHYFMVDEIKNLVQAVGFQLQTVCSVGYAKNTGEVSENLKTGNLFLFAVK